MSFCAGAYYDDDRWPASGCRGERMSIFLEVIEWTDQSGSEIIRRIPAEGSADLKFGTKNQGDVEHS